MNISSMIEQFIKEMLGESAEIELGRNELATRFNCVPSQINYVISTRFSPEKGYSVESRRGGGGYIKITRVAPRDESFVLHAISSIGPSISQSGCVSLINDMYSCGIISQREAKLLLAATSDSSLPIIPSQRGMVRAKIFKNMLVNL